MPRRHAFLQLRRARLLLPLDFRRVRDAVLIRHYYTALIMLPMPHVTEIPSYWRLFRSL